MHPQLKTSILPVASSDVPHLVTIHQTAFESDRFSNLMLLGRDPDAFRGLLLKSIETWMADPNAQLIKAVAEDGDIVGYACWVTEDVPEVKQPTTKPEQDPRTVDEQRKLLPRDLGKLMREDLVARKRDLMGNERHMVLQALVTDPKWQKMGVGARLVQWGTSQADVEGLSCWAHASPSGYGVYLRAGFEELGMSEYDLDQYLPEDGQDRSEWGVYTFRYMASANDMRRSSTFRSLFSRSKNGANPPAEQPTGPDASAGNILAPAAAEPSLDRELPAGVLPLSAARLNEKIWCEAYNQLKQHEPSLIMAYEKVLSSELNDASRPVSTISIIQRKAETIQQRMDETTGSKSQKTLILSILDGLELGIDETPEFVLIRASFWFAFDILLKSMRSNQKLLDGFIYVASRLGWYRGLTETLSLRLESSSQDPLTTPLAAGLASMIRALFTSIIKYQITIVCAFHSSRSRIYLRSILGFDDWEGCLAEIRRYEDNVTDLLKQFSSLETKLSLERILESYSRTQQAFLEINRSIQDRQINRDDKRCQQSLRLLDPYDDRDRIELKAGNILPSSNRWIIDHIDETWLNTDERLVCVIGKPGTGKTIAATAITRHLENYVSKSESLALAFFFCEAVSNLHNSPAAILRGLMYQLVTQKSDLMTHLRHEFTLTGSELFEISDEPSFQRLAKIFLDMLQDPSLQQTHLVIDGLDECEVGPLFDALLALISQTVSERRFPVKWLVLCRQRPQIDEDLVKKCGSATIDLSTNPDRTVDIVNYVAHQLPQVAETVRGAVTERAGDNFLWAALVVEEIKRSDGKSTKDLIQESSSDLERAYGRYLGSIQQHPGVERDVCLSVLKTLAVAFGRLHILSLPALAGLGHEWATKDALDRIFAKMNVLATVFNDYANLVHASLREYLLKTVVSGDLKTLHLDMFTRSIDTMALVLQKDVRRVKHVSLVQGEPKTPDSDPLIMLRYFCEYWVDHMLAAACVQGEHTADASIEEKALSFLENHFMHWFEALSLMGAHSTAANSIRKLLDALKASQDASTELVEFLVDAEIFLQSFSSCVRGNPMQAYGAALAFCPDSSKVKQLFWHERLQPIKRISGVGSFWDGATHTLRGHEGGVLSVAFSQRHASLASSSKDHTVRLWDLETGIFMRSLEGHTGPVLDVAFCPSKQSEAERLVSASVDKTLRSWDPGNDMKMTIWQDSHSVVNAVICSTDGRTVAAASRDKKVRLWDALSLQCTKAFDIEEAIRSIAFSPDGKLLAVATENSKTLIYSVPMDSHEPVKYLHGDGSAILCVGFSYDGRTLATGSRDGALLLWDVTSCTISKRLQGHDGAVLDLEFSPEDQVLVSSSSDRTLRIWDIPGGHLMRTLKGHRDWVNAVAISRNSERLASASHDRTVRLWNLSMIRRLGVEKQDTSSAAGAHSHTDVRALKISPDGRLVVSLSEDKTPKVWDTSSGSFLYMLDGHDGIVLDVAFSEDCSMISSASSDRTIRIWATDKRECVMQLTGHSRWVSSTAFSPDGSMLVSASYDKSVRLWDLEQAKEIQQHTDHEDWVTTVAFAPDGKTIMSASRDKTIRLWTPNKPKYAPRIIASDMIDIPKSLSFSVNGSLLKVGKSWIDIDTGDTYEGPPHQAQRASRISLKEEWVLLDGQEILWLPPSYRASCSDVHGDLLVLGHDSGRIIFLEFESDDKEKNGSTCSHESP